MVQTSDKVIVTCAITGGVHTPSMSPHLPFHPDDIAREAIAAAEAGASILHLHARDTLDGRPTADPDVFLQFLPRIKQATDAVINLTTGGSHTMSVEQRLAAALRARPEMTSLNMGSMNFAFHGMARKVSEWRYDWERSYVLSSEDAIFRNTFKDIAYIIETLGKGLGVRFEHECYDVGHLYNLAYFVDRGLIEPPFFVQTIFGILGGIGPDVENLMFMKATADRLFGNQYLWSVLGAGRAQMPLITHGALMGAHVRVGLEDNLWIDKAELAPGNAALVQKARRILAELGKTVATPSEARQMLRLRGGDDVGF